MEKERKKYPIGAEHYTMYEEVGTGVSASVHRALCNPLNEIVAIKILDFERNNSDLVTSVFGLMNSCMLTELKLFSYLCSEGENLLFDSVVFQFLSLLILFYAKAYVASGNTW
ncbi:hypothetical protein Sango_1701800 [Sesamum angolense]|uniref:Protein kinase domain-containing protein n=1 Tax=Sesamum angolense TaxID=2727404 RepID=A0AAE1WLG8_9LAMI|nr:hypothetical protein Sango_1701800 [Sesamum angolense]